MFKQIKNIFFFLTIIALLTGCGFHEIEGDKVYSVSWDEARGKTRSLIRGADAETFKELEHPKYAIDKNNVYFETRKLEGADPNTFKSLLNYYGKDKRFAYQSWRKIDGADGNSLEVIEGGPYSKDYKDYFFDTIAMKVSDLKTFKIINQEPHFCDLAKDKNFYYFLGIKHPLADYETFNPIDNGYFKDKYQVYFGGKIVKGVDPLSFKTIQYGYGKDNLANYNGEKKLNIKVPSKFVVLSLGFTKDTLHVYKNDSIVQGADPETFELIMSSMWQKDKNSYFFKGKLIPYVDYKTFRYLDYHYAVDKNNVYYDDEIIQGADSRTFIHIKDSQDGKDKNNCYRYGKNIDCLTIGNK